MRGDEFAVRVRASVGKRGGSRSKPWSPLLLQGLRDEEEQAKDQGANHRMLRGGVGQDLDTMESQKPSETSVSRR